MHELCPSFPCSFTNCVVYVAHDNLKWRPAWGSQRIRLGQGDLQITLSSFLLTSSRALRSFSSSCTTSEGAYWRSVSDCKFTTNKYT